MTDTRQVHSLSDFLRNYITLIENLKKTKTLEVLMVDGRAELVILDTETYQDLVERARNAEAIASLRAHMAQARNNAPPSESVAEADIERSQAIVEEIMDETERLGLYR